jgi:arylformamidase
MSASSGDPVDRRKALAGAAAAVGAAMLRPRGSAAENASSNSAPKVFLDYTQEELDQAYEQRVWAPNFEELSARYRRESEVVRQRLPHRVVAYGPSPDETLEVLPAATPAAPIHLFIHGGRWLTPAHEGFVYAAPTFVAAGATFVAARFATLPKVRLPDMVDQLRRAVAWLHANARSLGTDPARIHVSGHSSGGHLAAVLLTTDWAARGLPADVLKGGLCVSGMYDLRPVLLSSRSAYVKLDAEEEDALSPQRHLDRVRCPITVAYGDRESPEFQRHGRDFAAALAAARLSSSSLAMVGLNHFEGIMSLADPASPLARAALGQMGLAPA